MKRGFDENVPKLRPRVRLGRALEELTGEAQGEQEHETQPPPGIGLAAESRDERSPEPAAQVSALADEESTERRERLAQVRERATRAAQPLASAQASFPDPGAAADSSDGLSTEPRTPADLAKEKRARRAGAATQVAALARELTAELDQAAEANARLKVDLDGALSSLRSAAEEARDHSHERDLLAAEVEKRALAARELLAELELLEAERDGALAQGARASRELRDARSRGKEQEELLSRARAELEGGREAARRLAAELETRTAERDEARGELARLRSEKEELAGALLAARSEADDALESRSALEEIHQALAAARTRVAGIR